VEGVDDGAKSQPWEERAFSRGPTRATSLAPAGVRVKAQELGCKAGVAGMGCASAGVHGSYLEYANLVAGGLKQSRYEETFQQ
jgi:hypothetical protein